MAKEGLAVKVDSLVKQREEFHTQIKEFNEKKERERLSKKEMQRQNGEFWKVQVEQKT